MTLLTTISRIVLTPNHGGAAGGAADAAGDAASGAADAAVNGLEVAAKAAGDVLRAIFGCLPWESGCIVGEPAMIADVMVVVL